MFLQFVKFAKSSWEAFANMVKMKCITVDDDPISLRVMRQLIDRCEFLEQTDECHSAAEARKCLEKNQVDLIFLDIEMPVMSGLELLSILNNKPQIILVTGKKEYAADAFDYDVVDYLVKPVLYKRFLKAAEKAKVNHDLFLQEQDESNHIFVKVNSAWKKIDTESIQFIQAMSDYVGIHIDQGEGLKRYVIHSTMKSVQGKLHWQNFMRIHRSYIINVDKVDGFDGDQVYIKEKNIPVGVTHRKKISELVQKLTS